MDDDVEITDIERAIEASIQSYQKSVEDKTSELLAVSLQNEEFQCLNNNMDTSNNNNNFIMNFDGVDDRSSNRFYNNNNHHIKEVIDIVDSMDESDDIGHDQNENPQYREDYQVAQALDQSLQQYEITQLNDKMYNDAIRQKVEMTNDKNKGCWDCNICTYTNNPYQSKCKMCHNKAPCHILTFDNKYYRNIPFGVEIEIIIPHGKLDGFTFESIANSMTKLGPEAIHFSGYTHTTTTHWKMVTDSSLKENNRDQDLCFELVSPVLIGEKGLSSLRNIMSNVRSIGISTNTSCGFHVHIDATDNDSEHSIGSLLGLKRIAQHFVSLENAFDLIVARMGHNQTVKTGISRRANNNKYCQSNRILFGERSNRQRWFCISNVQTKEELVTLINPDRYRKLNIKNVINRDRPSTIEFRQHGGVEDIQIAEAWVRLVLSFCYNASRTDEVCILGESATPHDELHRLFQLVQCEGLQQFFTMDRKLFSNYSLANQWKCRVCRRLFDTSRSLAQHVAACGHR